MGPGGGAGWSRPSGGAVTHLHAFDDPEAEFRAVAAADPGCAIAWWGAAMTVRGNPLAGAPGREAFLAGKADIARAEAAHPRTAREAGLVRALAVYYRDAAEDHACRTRAYEAAMRRLAAAYPGNVEIAAFHALAILEAVDLTDGRFTRQLDAARISWSRCGRRGNQGRRRRPGATRRMRRR